MYHFQSAILNSPQRESSEQDFLLYARPLTSKLLESMEMAKHYYHGDGDYLFYEQNNKIHRVLDLTGGYGANLLGHRHPRILNKVREWSETGSPSLTQGSIRNESGRLARRISDILKQETGEGPWVSTFSNSGTEAVEAALKHCLIYFQHRLIQLEQEIEKEMNQALVKFKRTNASLQKDLLYQIRKDLTDKIEKLRMSEERKCFFLHEVSRSLDIDTLISVVRNINKLQTAIRPSFVALEKAYHGKTMGALSLTYSESFRHPFYLDTSNNLFTHFISPYQDAVSLQAFIESTLTDTIFLTNSSTGITWAKHSF